MYETFQSGSLTSSLRIELRNNTADTLLTSAQLPRSIHMCTGVPPD